MSMQTADKRDVKRVAFVAPQGKEPRVYPWVSMAVPGIAIKLPGELNVYVKLSEIR